VKDVVLALERLRSDRLKIDRVVKRYVTSQVLKVKQTGDEALEVLENQSGFDNTRDGNNKKGNKGKKSNKSKGKKK
jgi:predicted ATP-dependent serine protease